jgi:hypothetical protein
MSSLLRKKNGEGAGKKKEMGGLRMETGKGGFKRELIFTFPG